MKFNQKKITEVSINVILTILTLAFFSHAIELLYQGVWVTTAYLATLGVFIRTLLLSAIGLFIFFRIMIFIWVDKK